jgi:hypothetical protein
MTSKVGKFQDKIMSLPDDYDPLNPENWLDLPDAIFQLEKVELDELVVQQKNDNREWREGIKTEHHTFRRLDESKIDYTPTAFAEWYTLMSNSADVTGESFSKVITLLNKMNLTEKQTLCCLYAKFWRLSITEVARKMSVDESTVREHLAAAKKKYEKYQIKSAGKDKKHPRISTGVGTLDK